MPFHSSFTKLGATDLAIKKLYEREIATTARCGSIRTVQEKFPASHGTVFIHGPKVEFKGQQEASRHPVNLNSLERLAQPSDMRVPLSKARG
jgi:hypothetical protein